jgi:hypothetical protein
MEQCFLSHIFEECSFLENSMEQFLTPHFEKSSFFCGGENYGTFLVLTLSLVV